MAVNNDKNGKKEKVDNPVWGGRVEPELHEKLEKFFEESGIEKKGDFIKFLSELAAVHFAEEAMKDDFSGEYSKHYVELSKELGSYLLMIKHLFLKEVGGERVKWREINQELLRQKEENQRLIADWEEIKKGHKNEVANLHKELKEARTETQNAKDKAEVLEAKNKLLQQEKEHLQNVINDKDKMNVSLLDQLQELDGYKKERNGFVEEMANKTMLLKDKEQELVQLEKQRKLDVKEAITDTERRVQKEMFETVSKLQGDIKELYADIEAVRVKKDTEMDKARREFDKKANEMQKEKKLEIESILAKKDAEIDIAKQEAKLNISAKDIEIQALKSEIEVLKAEEK
ncbi:hypothetical protein [Bacillus cereus group sp. N24]|uniref:hypothetical protein n=1 Tax=Bacillus cereus group sp. N24 TaxID=2794592 RepID=UPI0018F6E130|nr:hypothetical protein [Bacillus cereus group sp. N24]MBJ7950122.1 hypothetical protein [Bacillus cereus group sp. N24]